jgi:FkbM family methyltransferase
MNESKKLVYDVGMHKGEDTDFYLKKGCKVIAFEADPDLAELCRQRFSEQIKTEQLTIVEGAIVDVQEHKKSNGKIKFFKNNKTSVWGTVVDDWANRNNQLGAGSEIIEVSIINFSECLKQFGVPYYLKIDIEGMDVICLKSLKDFTERPDYISIESEKVSFDKLMEEFRIFKELGYDSFQVVNQSKITSNKEPGNTAEGNYLNYQFQEGASGLFGKDLSKDDWKSFEESIKRYKQIFNGYKFLGDYSRINKTFVGRIFTKSLNRLFGIPGWYDTHARHSSVKS